MGNPVVYQQNEKNYWTPRNGQAKKTDPWRGRTDGKFIKTKMNFALNLRKEI